MIDSKLQSCFKKNIVCCYIGTISFVIISCNHTPKNEAKYVSPAIAAKDSALHRFRINDVDNKKDPSCGMPLTAGIGDSLHYNGKVLGF
jgi:hypothetical protein